MPSLVWHGLTQMTQQQQPMVQASVCFGFGHGALISAVVAFMRAAPMESSQNPVCHVLQLKHHWARGKLSKYPKQGPAWHRLAQELY